MVTTIIPTEEYLFWAYGGKCSRHEDIPWVGSDWFGNGRLLASRIQASTRRWKPAERREVSIIHASLLTHG